MKALRNLSCTRVPALLAVGAILSAAFMFHAAMAQEEKAVESFPAVLQRDITLWSDGTRLSGVLLYPKDREEGKKLPAIVLCNGWGGTKAFLMQSGIAPRFAAAGYVVIDYDYRGWGDSDSRLVVRGEMPKPDKDGYVTVKAQAIREVVDPVDQQKDIDAAISYVHGERMVDQDRIGIWGTSVLRVRLVKESCYEVSNSLYRCALAGHFLDVRRAVSLAETTGQEQEGGRKDLGSDYQERAVAGSEHRLGLGHRQTPRERDPRMTVG